MNPRATDEQPFRRHVPLVPPTLPFLQVDLIITIFWGQPVDVQLPQAIRGFTQILQLRRRRLELGVGFTHCGADLGRRGAEHGLDLFNVRRRLADALVLYEFPSDGSKAIHAQGKHDFVVGLFAQQALGLGGLVAQDVGNDGGSRVVPSRNLGIDGRDRGLKAIGNEGHVARGAL